MDRITILLPAFERIIKGTITFFTMDINSRNIQNIFSNNAGNVLADQLNCAQLQSVQSM